MPILTLSQVIETSIAAEQAAEKLYLGLADMFVHYPDVAHYWLEYAREEAQHAQWLETLRQGKSPEALSEPVNKAVADMANKLDSFSVEKALSKVETLDDAYQLVTNLENSEINTIFNFVVNHLGVDEETLNFLRQQLEEHVSQLSNRLPAQYFSQLSRLTVVSERWAGASPSYAQG